MVWLLVKSWGLLAGVSRFGCERGEIQFENAGFFCIISLNFLFVGRPYVPDYLSVQVFY